MSYDLPSVDQFKERFPIFQDRDDTLIQAIMNETKSSIDDSWIEADYQPAVMYLTAHLLATDNSDEGGEVEVGSAGAGGVASESFGGGLSVSYDKGRSSGSLSSSDRYGTTEYGRRFLALLRSNKPAIVVVT